MPDDGSTFSRAAPDLDRLRETAMVRLTERRNEAAQFDRLRRRQDGDGLADRKQEDDPNGRQQRRDEQRDQARLDGRTSSTGRSDDG